MVNGMVCHICLRLPRWDVQSTFPMAWTFFMKSSSRVCVLPTITGVKICPLMVAAASVIKARLWLTRILIHEDHYIVELWDKKLAVWAIWGAILPLGYRDYEIATDIESLFTDQFMIPWMMFLFLPRLGFALFLFQQPPRHLEKGSLYTYIYI